MNDTTHVFRFQPGVLMEDVEAAVLLATLAAEAIHGRAQVRLHGWFQLDAGAMTMSCDTNTAVGASIASVFTVLAGRMLGENAFEVETAGRINSSDSAKSNGGGAHAN